MLDVLKLDGSRFKVIAMTHRENVAPCRDRISWIIVLVFSNCLGFTIIG